VEKYLIDVAGFSSQLPGCAGSPLLGCVASRHSHAMSAPQAGTSAFRLDFGASSTNFKRELKG
jgi:hypothetical protein